MICPSCSTDGAYVGLMVVECASENCSHFSIKAPGYKPKVISTPELTQFGRERRFRFEIEFDGIKSFPIERVKDVLKYPLKPDYPPYGSQLDGFYVGHTFKRATEESYKTNVKSAKFSVPFLQWTSSEYSEKFYREARYGSFLVLEGERSNLPLPVSSVDMTFTLNQDHVSIEPLQMFIEKPREKK